MDGIMDRHPSHEVLCSLALGQVDDATFAEVEKHVAHCEVCAQVLAQTPGDSFTALLQAAQSFSDTSTPQSAVTLTMPTPAGKAETTAVWESGVDAGFVAPPAELKDHPRYRLIRPLGHGGMGAVWLAEHKLMGRVVAVKVIRPDVVARVGAKERFQREANSAARLHHANIVTAYDFEQAGDIYLLAMEYVEGTSLAEEVRRRGPLPVAEACECIRQTALGLQHAHEKGLVHRDLKPQNLMLQASPVASAPGVVKILDFGLAVPHDAADANGGLTGANIVVGTPDYIAPEQAEDSRKADVRSDVYALGCTLYQLLTGSVPFPGDSTLRKLDAHRTLAPTPVRKHRPEIPEGLAAVVAKMMAKRPGERYLSAAAVAEALEPFTRQVPPPRRRRPLVAAMLAFVCAGFIAAAGVIIYIVTDNGTIEIRTDDDSVKIVAEKNGKQITILDPKSKQTWIVDSGDWTVQLEGNPEGLKIELPHTFTLKRGDKQVVVVKRLPPGPGPGGGPAAEEKVGEVRRIEAHEAGILTVAYSPDGTLALSGGGHAGDDAVLRLWDVRTGKLVRRLEGHTAVVWSLAFSPDGKRALSGSSDKTMRLWDVATGNELKRFHTEQHQVAFFADGKRALSGADDTVIMWHLDNGKELKRFEGATKIRTIAIAPDGKHFLSGGFDKSLCLWDLETGKIIRTLVGHTGGIISVAFAPDGRRAVSGGYDQIVRLWDIDTGKELHSFKGHDDSIHAVAFAPDGRRLLSGSYDRSMRLWDIDARKELHTFWGHNSVVLSVAFSPNEPFALSSSQDKTLRLWRLPEPQLAAVEEKVGEVRRIAWLDKERGCNAHIFATAFSPDGRLYMGFGDGGARSAVRVWNVATGKEVTLLTGTNSGHSRPAAFVLEGKAVLTCYESDPVIYLWDAETGKIIRKFEGDEVYLAVSPDGKRMLSRAADKTLRIWDLATGKETQRLKEPGKSGAFSPDGKRAFALHEDGARLWDAETGAELHRLEGHLAADIGVAFAADGKRLVTYGTDGSLRLWDTATGKAGAVLKSSADDVWHAAFVDGGRRLVSWGKDRIVRTWDAETGAEVSKLDLGQKFHPDPGSIGLGPCGRRLLVRSNDTTDGTGMVLVLDLATGKELLRFTNVDRARGFSFSPDGRYAAAGSFRTFGVVLWRLPELPPSAVTPPAKAAALEIPQLLLTSKRTGNSDIYLMNLDGTGAKNLTNNPANDILPAWSPDASKIAFVSNRDGSDNLYVMNADGSNVKQITKGPGTSLLPAWSPDGTKILFTRVDKGNRLFVVDPQGGKEQQLTGLNEDGFDASWSPDGKKIAFASGRSGKGFRVNVMDADGGNVKEITATNSPFGWVHTAWSPDGKKIAYSEDIGGALEVFVCDPDGKNHKQLTRLGEVNTYASWSSDSKQIIFQHLGFGIQINQPGPVYIMDADGGNQRILFQQEGPGHVAWKPGTPPPPARVGEAKVGEVRWLDGKYPDVVWGTAFAPDGKSFFTTGRLNPLQERDTGKVIRHLPKGSVGSWYAAYSPQGDMLLTGDFSDSGAVLWDPGSGKEVRRLPAQGRNQYGVFSKDGRWAATNQWNKVKVWETATGKELATLEANFEGGPGAAFTPDGKLLLIAQGDGSVATFDTATWKEVGKRMTHPGSKAVRSLALSQDGRKLLTHSLEGSEVLVWDVATRQVVRQLPVDGKEGGPKVAFCPDNERALYTNHGGVVILCDIANGKVLQRWETQVPIVSVAVAPDGRDALFGTWDKRAFLLSLPEPRMGQNP